MTRNPLFTVLIDLQVENGAIPDEGDKSDIPKTPLFRSAPSSICLTVNGWEPCGCILIWCRELNLEDDSRAMIAKNLTLSEFRLLLHQSELEPSSVNAQAGYARTERSLGA